MQMNSKNTKKMLLALATMFQEKRDELAMIDSVIGDGDHGISMARGAKTAYEAVDIMPDDAPINEYFKVYGRSLVAEMGGAIGPLFGIVFTEFGKCVKDEVEITPTDFAQSLENSMNKVMEFGGAKPNDKTMVDAMIPAADAAINAMQEGKTLAEIARSAAEGARKGVKATITMRSHRGRSKFLQEKSIGHQDAGATSYYYLLNRMAEYFEGKTDYTPYYQTQTTEKKEEYTKKSVINKFINDPGKIVEETVNGYVKAYSHKLKKLPNANVVVRKKMTPNKVGVIIGNGSGHEPACLGFIGENFLDANAYGGIFAAPGPYNILEAIKATDTGRGVCVLISSHAGDILNSKMAIDMAEDDGVLAKSVLLYDDIASAPKNEPVSERRGSIGTLFNYKMTPAYAAQGHTLDEVVAFSEKVRDNTRSIAAAMKPGISPVTGEAMFKLEPGEVLVGLGVHGESALLTYENQPCREIAEGMIKSLMEEIPYAKGEELAIIVNGAGGTTMMELMIFYTAIEAYLTKIGVKIYRPLIGSFITTQEMGGIGLAVCRMDDTMKKAWITPTTAPQFPNL